MNCWKTINVNKEMGVGRIYFVSFFIGLLTFMFLFVTFSIYHHHASQNSKGFLPFLILLISLPTIHSVTHILPCIYLPKKTGVITKLKGRVFPMFYFFTKSHLSKRTSILIALTPLILLTVPGLMITYLFKDFYMYAAILTACHIGLSFKDYLCLIHLFRAPKSAYVSNQSNELDILIKPSVSN